MSTNAEACKRYYASHREEMKAKQSEYRRTHKSESFERVKAHTLEKIVFIRTAKEKPCVDCGIQYPYFVMQFDHVRGTKRFNLGGRGQYHSREDIEAEIAKCDVVCANCHAARTYSRLVAVM